jgi:hypothetical protein
MINRFIAACLFAFCLSSSVFAQTSAVNSTAVTSPPPGPSPLQYTDPTRLTTEQLDRAIVNLDLRLSAEIKAVRDAVTLAHEDLVRVPTTVDKAILGLRELEESNIAKLADVTNEKFIKVDGQFNDRDKQAVASSTASATAIAAALQAQKEAVADQNKFASAVTDKSEKALLDALAQQRTLNQAETASFQTQLTDLKGRLDRSEGNHTGSGDTYTLWIAIIAAGASVILAVVVIMDRGRRENDRREDRIVYRNGNGNGRRNGNVD